MTTEQEYAQWRYASESQIRASLQVQRSPVDRTDEHPKPREGQVVRVTRLPMAPKENVMGMCYVADKETGEFIGMVMTSSLTEHDRDS